MSRDWTQEEFKVKDGSRRCGYHFYFLDQMYQIMLALED